MSDPHKNIIEEAECDYYPEFLSPVDPWEYDSSWASLYQELLAHESTAAAAPPERSSTVSKYQRAGEASAYHVNDEQLAAAGVLMGNELKLMRINNISAASSSKTNSTRTKKISMINDENGELEAGPLSSAAKKLDHNAKERIRRMKITASYLALRALLPHYHYSRRSKKRWSAPAIVDRVLKYIPELETEVETLKSEKQNIILQSADAAKSNNVNNIHNYENPSTSQSYQNDHTVSVTKVDQQEAIVQICMGSRSEEDGSIFTKLLRSVEDDEGILSIKSASSLNACHTRICYHLHIQINQSSSEGDSVEELRDKVISWLR